MDTTTAAVTAPDDGRPPGSGSGSGSGPGPDTTTGAATTWRDEGTLLEWPLFSIVAVILLVTAALCSQVLPSNVPPPISDNFARTNPRGLVQTSSGAVWENPVGDGTWATEDGYAYVATPTTSDGGRTMAVVNMASNNGTVSARIGQVASGWGLVFRFKGAADFWMITASPQFASFKVQRAVKAKVEALGTIALARQDPGTEIRIEMDEATVTVLIDGRLAGTFDDPGASAGAFRAGLLLADPTGLDARWTRFATEPRAASPYPPLPAGLPTTSLVPA